MFFKSLSISAYVVSKPSGWKTGSHPKSLGPRASTMLPGVRPTNVMGSASGPGGGTHQHQTTLEVALEVIANYKQNVWNLVVNHYKKRVTDLCCCCCHLLHEGRTPALLLLPSLLLLLLLLMLTWAVSKDALGICRLVFETNCRTHRSYIVHILELMKSANTA